MYGTDIVLRNDCGCELARITVGKYEEPAEALVRAIQKELWSLNEGDKITIECAWHEEEQK